MLEFLRSTNRRDEPSRRAARPFGREYEHRWVNFSLVVSTVCLVGILLVGSVASATIQTVHDTTAAGYTADFTGSGKTLDSVKGFWTVPTVKASNVVMGAYESVSIGSGDTIIQIGTNQYTTKSGQVVYGAWYWASPEQSNGPTHITTLDGKVGPGKVIGARIIDSGLGNWTIVLLAGTSTGFTDSFIINILHNPGKVEAGWILQPDPSYPLADFSSVNFFWTNATIDGVQLRLDQLSNQRSRLYDSSNTCNLADTSDVSSSNPYYFSVTFVQSSAPCPTSTTPTTSQTQASGQLQANPNFTILLAIGGFLVGGVVVAILATAIISNRKKNALMNTMLRQQPPSITLGLCSRCGASFKPGARFCDNCGQAVL